MDMEKLKIAAVLTNAAVQSGKVSAEPDDVVSYLKTIYEKVECLTTPKVTGAVGVCS